MTPKSAAASFLFQRLFSNLLDNAVRYTPPGGKVEFELGSDDEKISILVKDSGIGIEPEYKEKIFDEFFRPDLRERLVKRHDQKGDNAQIAE